MTQNAQLAKMQFILCSAKTKKYLTRFLIGLIIFGVLGFFALPPLLKYLIENKLSATLHRPVSIKSLEINPYTITLTINEFKIAERTEQQLSETLTDAPLNTIENISPNHGVDSSIDSAKVDATENVDKKTAISTNLETLVEPPAQPVAETNLNDFASFEQLYVDVKISSLFRLGLVVNEIRLVKPRIKITRLAEGHYNFSDLIDEFIGKPKSSESSTNFSLNNIQLTDGHIEFDDYLKKSQHNVENINLSIPFVSNMAYAVESFVEPAFSATIDGSPFVLTGKSKFFADSLESEIALELNEFQLAKYLEYSPIELPVKIISGALSTHLKIVFHQEKDSVEQANTLADAQENTPVNTQKNTPANVSLAPADKTTPKSTNSQAINTPEKTSSESDENLNKINKSENGLFISGELAIKNLQVKDNAGSDLLSFNNFELAIAESNLLNNQLRIDKIALESPKLHARVNRQGRVNWIDFFEQNLNIQKPAKTTQPAPTASALPTTTQKTAQKPTEKTPENDNASALKTREAPKKPLSWSIAEAKISAGSLRWLDESNAKPFTAAVETLNVSLKNLSNEAKSSADFDASWRLDAQDWLQVKDFSLKKGKFDLSAHRVSIDAAHARGVQALFKRSTKGEIEWIKPPTLRAVEASQKETKTPWLIEVAHYTGEEISLRFEDNAISPPVTQRIDNLNFTANSLSTEAGHSANVSLRFKLNQQGEIEVAGSVETKPFSTDLKLNVKALSLLPLQPYFSEYLNVSIARGQLSLNGDLKLKEINSPSSEKKIAGGFNGNATFGDFQVLDKLNSTDFLRWKSFHFGEIDWKFNPNSIAVGDISLADFFARVIVSPEGKLNLLHVVRQKTSDDLNVVPSTNNTADKITDNVLENSSTEGEAKISLNSQVVQNQAGQKTEKLPIKIGKITFQGGLIRFSDNFIKPNYTANLKAISGNLIGLSSDSGSFANLELRGTYDNVAPLTIKAKLNPLSAKRYLDLQAEVKGIELSTFSSYFSKYAGYAIEKGKLSLNVKYQIENDLLEAQNRIFLDQLTFGERVDSPSATKLPVSLAVALLKNRSGEIDLNLPVSGSLDDPQFSVGSVLFKVLGNLIGKAITSPFALIGSMFGGSEELSTIEFDAGRSSLTPEALSRLEKLSKALLDRPDLKLEIEGRAELEAEQEDLKRVWIDRKIRRLKRDDLKKTSTESFSLKDIVLTPEEYPALLERVYSAAKFPKPRNVVGLVKSLPPEEMEKLLFTNEFVETEDLQTLGDRRAKAARDWLIEQGVDADRIFLLPSKIAASGDAEKSSAKKSRADFKLR